MTTHRFITPLTRAGVMLLLMFGGLLASIGPVLAIADSMAQQLYQELAAGISGRSASDADSVSFANHVTSIQQAAPHGQATVWPDPSWPSKIDSNPATMFADRQVYNMDLPSGATELKGPLTECGKSARSATTVCAAGTSAPLTGKLIVFTTRLGGAVPTTDPTGNYQYTVVLGNGDANAGYQPAGATPNDFNRGSLWQYQLARPAGGQWQLNTTETKGNALHARPSAARAIVQPGVLTWIVPAGEIAAPNPAFRLTSRHYVGEPGPQNTGDGQAWPAAATNQWDHVGATTITAPPVPAAPPPAPVAPTTNNFPWKIVIPLVLVGLALLGGLAYLASRRRPVPEVPARPTQVLAEADDCARLRERCVQARSAAKGAARDLSGARERATEARKLCDEARTALHDIESGSRTVQQPVQEGAAALTSAEQRAVLQEVHPRTPAAQAALARLTRGEISTQQLVRALEQQGEREALDRFRTLFRDRGQQVTGAAASGLEQARSRYETACAEAEEATAEIQAAERRSTQLKQEADVACKAADECEQRQAVAATGPGSVRPGGGADEPWHPGRSDDGSQGRSGRGPDDLASS